MRTLLAIVVAIGLSTAAASPAHATVPNLPTCPSCGTQPFDPGNPYLWIWNLPFGW